MIHFHLPHLRKRHIALLLCLLLITMVRHMPHAGAYYTTHIYPIIANVLSHITSWIPFPLGDVFIAASIAALFAVPFYAIIRKKCRKSTAIGRVMEYLAWIYVWFYAAWGLNYSQPDIYRRLDMQPAKVSNSDFLHFAQQVVDSVNATYMADSMIRIPQAIAAIHQGYQHWTSSRQIGINAPFAPSVHGKTMLFSHLSSQAGVTGSMAPFFCEFTINADVLPHSYPATYAHEYAHMLGITNEGEANFYSFLICSSSPQRAVRYSGYLHLLPHVMHQACQLLTPEEQHTLFASINPAITKLLHSDARYWQLRRSPIVDGIQNFMFNLYLKGNNVEEGIHSYSGVVAIIMAWNALHDFNNHSKATKLESTSPS